MELDYHSYTTTPQVIKRETNTTTWTADSPNCSPLSSPITLRGSVTSFQTTTSDTASTSSQLEPLTPLGTTTTFEKTTPRLYNDTTLSSLESFQFEPVPKPHPSPKSTHSKRNGRKLPPRLTESLENLSLTIAPLSKSPSSTFHRPSVVLEVIPPLPPMSPNTMYQLNLDKSLPDLPADRASDEILPLHRVQLPSSKLESKRSFSSLHRQRKHSKARAIRRSLMEGYGQGSRSSWTGAPPSSSSVASTNLVTPSTSMLRTTESICSTAHCEFDDFHRSWATPEDNHPSSPYGSSREPAKIKENRKQRKARRKAEALAFDESALPSMRSLYDAGNLEVIDEDGEKVRFGNLIRDRKTIVVFIRHWFCPLCAQYMQSIVSQVRPEALEAADVNLIIIGNGSAKMLPAYKNKAFNCPFPMYTDPSLQLYRALGQTRQTGDAGADEDAGDYLVQTAMQATVSTVKRATMMPLRNPGHFTQLGGEFIFDGALNCTYAHRMTTTRSHAPIRDVCEEAGVRLEWVHYEPGEGPPPVHRASFHRSLSDFNPQESSEQHRQDDTLVNSVVDQEAFFTPPVDSRRDSAEMNWQANRDDEIERIKNLKRARRVKGVYDMSSLKGLSTGTEGQGAAQEVQVVGDDEVLDLAGNLHALGITV